MADYCISQALESRMSEIPKTFTQEAQFDPMEHCITIARACNMHWSKHHLRPDCIAVEPPGGWHGVPNN